MRNQLQLSEVTESLERGKSYIQVPRELYDLQDLCFNEVGPQLLEYVPVKIVACFEQFFRDEYKEILLNPQTKNRLNKVEYLKDAKFDFDLIGAFEDNTITLSDYLSLLIPCSKMADIDKAVSQLLDIKFSSEFRKKENGATLLKSIDEIFKLRHIYCHEVPVKKTLEIGHIRNLISHAIEFLDYSDDIIRNKLYPENLDIIEEIKNAEESFYQANKELEELIETIKSKQDGNSLFYNDFSYVEKWKEYRKERALCDSSVNKKESYMPLWYYRNQDRTTRTLIKELKKDYKEELKR